MTQLKVHLLGTPSVRRGDRSIPVRRRKAIALLAYLAVTGRGHTREALTTLLWPETEKSRGHASLRNLLWILKQEAAPVELSADFETVDLLSGSIWTDVGELRDRSRAGRGTGGRGAELHPADAGILAGCLPLYRDHFMTGFGLKDSYSFEEWQLQERESLRVEFASVLERLVGYHRSRHEYDQAIACGRRWISLDPFDEPALREIMDLYTEAGQRSAALELYEQSARLLEKELGLSPAEETMELRERILSAGLARITRAAAEKPRHNLPARETRFVGREAEMGELRRLLGDPDGRLLTVVGAGGSGKTRLAIQAAEEQLPVYPDGVFFVPLAPVESPKHLVSAIVGALDVPLSRSGGEKEKAERRAGSTEKRLLKDYLREKRALLILDNMEHLLGALDDTREILEEAPGLRVIATSRERLRMGGEYVLELQGLPCPKEGADQEEFDSSAAVLLFLNAAKRAEVSFKPKEDDREAIGRICRRLQGSPLGIELAAAWTKMFRSAEIDAELEKNLDFLRSRQRSVPERHRSMRAVFEHSWILLSEKERTCFRRLASFRGGFTREAARETADCPTEVLELLADKSLLHADPSGRCEIHEVLRQFAEEELRKNPEEHETILRRLVDYYLKKLDRLEKALEGEGQKEALLEIAREIENIRNAWLRAAEGGRTESMSRAVLTLFLYFDIRSRFQEGADLFDGAIRALESRAGERETDLLLGALRAGQAWFVRYERIGHCEELIRSALRTLEPLGPTVEYAFALVVSAILFPGPSEEELARIEKARAIFEEKGRLFWTAMALEVISTTLAWVDPEEALRQGQKCLAIRHQLKDLWGIALSHVIMGKIAEEQNLPRVAKKRYWESVKIRRRMGEDLDGSVCILERIGTVARRTGDFDEAYRLFEECIRLSREMGHPWRTAFSRTRLGMIAYDMGRWDRAREELESAVDFAQSLGDVSWVNLLHAVLANNAFLSGDPEEARFLLGRITDMGEALRSNERNPPLEIRSVRGYRSAWIDLAAGRIAAEDGNREEALRRLRKTIRLSSEERDEPTAFEALGEIARVRFASGDEDGAARLLGFLLDREALTPAARKRAEELRIEMIRKMKAAGLRAAMVPGGGDDFAGTVRRELGEGDGEGAG